ncbi:MAG: ABC transporter permease [Gammaproteobacteria bacterium]|nr:ABC transporter permease [Gammaproteobacteria bacterium]
MQDTDPPPTIRLSPSGSQGVQLALSGAWTLDRIFPSDETVRQLLAQPDPPQSISFQGQAVSAWDSGLLTYLLELVKLARSRGIKTDLSGLPGGVRRLIALSLAVPEHHTPHAVASQIGLPERLGRASIKASRGVSDFLVFLGQTAMAFSALIRGRARHRPADFLLLLQEAGAQALPIVSLVSLLVGLILAFIGAVQLRQFGAEIYVADLVGIAMARQMGALMTGIILAGRTGAAYAAQLGTMQANEEIDALRTLGVSPIEFLVVPRVLAMLLMMPLLSAYSVLMGILGGALVCVTSFDISFMEYYTETVVTVTLPDFIAGTIYSVAFAAIVALSGCLRGMQSGRNASAVGTATTSAVVTAIVWIVVADAILTVLFNAIDF